MSDDADEDREAILRRRRRFVATALAGASLTIATSCQPCLRYAPDTGPADAGTDGGDDEAADAGE